MSVRGRLSRYWGSCVWNCVRRREMYACWISLVAQASISFSLPFHARSRDPLCSDMSANCVQMNELVSALEGRHRSALGPNYVSSF